MNIKKSTGPRTCRLCLQDAKAEVERHVRENRPCNEPNCPLRDIINEALEKKSRQPNIAFGEKTADIRPRVVFGKKKPAVKPNVVFGEKKQSGKPSIRLPTKSPTRFMKSYINKFSKFINKPFKN